MPNQTIDGVLVPRELALRLAVPMLRTPEYLLNHRDALDELRALLDAPAVKPRPFGYWLTPKTCAGLAMFQRELIEDPVLTASVVEYFHVTPLYDTPAAQPQGEPVAYQRKSKIEGSEWHYIHGCDVAEAISMGFEVRPLYAEQPAPVAQVNLEEEDAQKGSN